MAKYNEVLAGRFNRALQRLMSMKGEPPAPQLAGEIMPVLPFEDAESTELRYINQWDQYATYQTQAGIAAQTAAIKLRNPPGSGAVVAFQKLTVFGTAVDQPIVQGSFAPGADYATVFSTLNMDGRAQNRGSVMVGTKSNTGVSFGTFWSESCAINANTSYDFIVDPNQEIVLLPGWAVQVISNQLNTTLNAVFMWRERYLEPSELL